ncbi:uncharacterized protein B0J16DRAFT_402519 [Fusarium flagelliforme]|uniref:uncharacterized protein n=1 Tax=Fusarium flagelliforme TaxID=2675880 RepID=UPI001E8D0A30|nr:uncharacterized protein B0J16DRAFT_402519 [Fusarium flagelliforme]KAH7179130.1 hypothetical protein B0J16DRAFT_402519 [Fusarium flagelliforme]
MAEQYNWDSVPSSNFNPVDRERRRQFIKARFEHSRQWNVLQWELLHKTEEVKLCTKIQQRGLRWVGADFFDYAVDSIAWVEYVKLRGLDRVQFSWPWSDEMRPKVDDAKGGRSQTFKTWLEDEGRSV